MLRLFFILIAFSVLLKPLYANYQDEINTPVINQVNVLRQEAGLSPLKYSRLLAQAAQNHANYLSRYVSKTTATVDMHAERENRPGFSGEHAWERAQRAGYLSRSVKENISAGNADANESIANLMSGIYHRFTFLDFYIDTLGYGTATHPSGYTSYVYNMGRKDMEDLCSQRPDAAKPRKMFDCLGTKVSTDYLEKACASLPQEAIYQAIFPYRCPNGVSIQAQYMDRICQSKPEQILFKGNGSYFKMCEPAIKVKADWFNTVCRSHDPSIIHSGETRYYEICKNKKRVYASWLSSYCRSATASDKNMGSAQYTEACHSGFKVSMKYIEQLDRQHLEHHPDFIVWPPLGARGVLPAFYEEIPDPLPDRKMSGYPLSLQFNVGKVKSVKLSHFKLEKVVDSQTRLSVQHIREINKKTDPQKIFSSYQYAWFPLQRLEWGAFYRASVTAVINGRERRIHWAFKTQSIDIPLLTVSPNQRDVDVPEGKWFALYMLAGRDDVLPLQHLTLNWQGSARVEPEVIDSHTVKIKLENTSCRVVKLKMSNGRVLNLNTC